MTVILIVEDEQEIRDTLEDMLMLDGYDIIHAADGLEGLQAARQSLPDLIISDIMMPEMDGYQLFRELKRDINTANIPFIFLSALSTYDDLREGMNIGADDYLTKPFDYQQVSQAVSGRLKRHIERENLRLKELNARLIQTQERNYKQIAETLSGVLGEPLKGLNLLLSVTSNLDSNIVEEVHQVVDGLVDQVNSISLQLHPTMLEHLGMLSIIRWLSEMYRKRHGLQVSFLHAGLHDGLSSTTKITIYRLLDEALLNVVKHAETSEAEVKLRVKQEMIELDIIDSGVGFNVKQVLDRGGTTGLPTMIARTNHLGGEINVRSIDQVGTHIHVDLPLAAESAVAEEDVAPTPPRRAETNGRGRKTKTLVLAEDHDIIRQGIRRLLEKSGTYTIVGELANGHNVLPFIRQQQPEVLILDMSVAGLTGMEILKVISNQYPSIKVLAFSPYKEEIYALEALKHGAAGYILTESPSIEILRALDTIVTGQQYVTPLVTLNETSQDGLVTEIGEEEIKRAELTGRESEILLLVGEGLTSAQIGERLSISPRTVEKHRSNLIKKLGVKNQMQLMAYAINQQR